MIILCTIVYTHISIKSSGWGGGGGGGGGYGGCSPLQGIGVYVGYLHKHISTAPLSPMVKVAVACINL